MKKITLFIMSLVFCLSMAFTSCNSCNRNNQEIETEELTYPVTGLDVNYINVSDLDWMGMNHSDKNWEWVECCVDMANFIDESDGECEVVAVANIFKYIEVVDTVTGAFRPMVILWAHVADTSVIEYREGLWVGDNPMNDYNPMEVDFAHAWNYMMMANCVKPHSKHCVLRKEVGPIGGLDPIYIFGNEDAQVYVMSNTGDVTTTNPAFPSDGVLEMTEDTTACEYEGTIYGPNNMHIGCPLGEWP